MKYSAREIDPQLMKITVEELKGSEVKLTVELTEKQMEEFGKKAVEALQGQVKIDGFRKGSIPLEILKKHVGEQAFLSQTLDAAVTDSYEDAVSEKKLRPVAYPKINILEQSPLKYEATIPVVPTMKWKKDIKKLSIKPEKIEVKKEEIEEVHSNLKTRSTKWEDVDRVAKTGDRVEIDFDGFDKKDDKPLDGTSSKNHPLILGSNSFIPGFEEEVVGMKKDEEKDFDITFPKDYQAEHFQGKKVRFHVKALRIEEPKEPKLDDEFAKEVTAGNRKTMKELDEEITEELLKKKEKEEISRQEGAFIKELPAYVDAEIPQVLVDREIDFMIERIKEDLKKQKRSWEDYEAEMKKDGKEIRKELEKPAKEQVLIRLALETLHADNKTEVTDKEVETEIEDMIAFYPPHFAPMVKQRYEDPQTRDFLKNQIMLRKLVKIYVDAK
jgi:trigger factor